MRQGVGRSLAPWHGPCCLKAQRDGSHIPEFSGLWPVASMARFQHTSDLRKPREEPMYVIASRARRLSRHQPACSYRAPQSAELNYLKTHSQIQRGLAE